MQSSGISRLEGRPPPRESPPRERSRERPRARRRARPRARHRARPRARHRARPRTRRREWPRECLRAGDVDEK